MTDTVKEFKVKVDQFSFSFGKAEIEKADIVATPGNGYHLISAGRSVLGKVSDFNHDPKTLSVEIDGEIFTVQIIDQLDQMLDQMGFGISAGKQLKEIKAPMPGLVLEIAVKEGEQASAGQKLLILEAMKMENSILIQADALIRKVNVIPGQAVEKGQVLFELE
jgi:biotin carboxyl carrier protein